MTLIRELDPEVIHLCRPLIFNEEQLKALVKLFAKRWRQILGMKEEDEEMEKCFARQMTVSDGNEDSSQQTIKNSVDLSGSDRSNLVLRFEHHGRQSRVDFFGRNSEPSTYSLSFRKKDVEELQFKPGKSRVTGESGASKTFSENGVSLTSAIECSSKLAADDTEREPDIPVAPLYKIINISIFPTGKEEGKVLGLGVNQDIIDIALVTTYGEGDYSTVTASYPGTNWRFLPLNVADALAKFITEKNLQETNIAMTVAAYSSGMPDYFLAELREKMSKFPELQNVFITDTVLSNTCGLVFAGKFETANTKFGITLGEKIEFCIIKKILTESGRKRRSVLVVNGSEMFDAVTMESMRTEIDDPKLSDEDLVSADGLPHLVQKYMIAAIKQAKLLRGTIPEKFKDKGAIKFEDVLWLGRQNSEDSDSDLQHSNTELFLRHLGFKKITDHDCLQVEFIARTIARRSCYVIGASAIALALLFNTKSVKFVISGPLLYFPNYGYYFRKVVKSLEPEGREITTEDMGRNGACLGAALFAASEAKELIRKLDGKRRLPPFHLKTCCLDCKSKCGCKGKWA